MSQGPKFSLFELLLVAVFAGASTFLLARDHYERATLNGATTLGTAGRSSSRWSTSTAPNGTRETSGSWSSVTSSRISATACFWMSVLITG